MFGLKNGGWQRSGPLIPHSFTSVFFPLQGNDPTTLQTPFGVTFQGLIPFSGVVPFGFILERFENHFSHTIVNVKTTFNRIHGNFANQ
jgi:hypothetical protein